MPNYDKLPLFPLHAVLFPQMPLPLHIFEERYRSMIGRCIERSEPFGVVLLSQGAEVETGGGDERKLYSVGTTARIERAEQLSDGRFFISVRGDTRFRIIEEFDDEPYLTARVNPLWDTADDPLKVQPIFDVACELFRDYVGYLLSGSQRRLSTLQLPRDPGLLSYAIGASLQASLGEKQRLLEAKSAGARLQHEIEIMQAESLDFGDPAQPAGENDCEGDGAESDQTGRRTISRLDPSNLQCFFSKN